MILFNNSDGVAGVVRALDANGASWGAPHRVPGERRATRLGISGGRVSMGYLNDTQILYEEDNVSPAGVNWTAVEP